MSFEAVAAEAYDRFMGRYSTHLSSPFADFARVASGARVIEVGSGPGALTGELVRRLGADGVTAVEPSPTFAAALRVRQPDVQVVQAPAERIPFPDAAFDAALAQLVVHFMDDPVAGLREMARVTREGGAVAACVWDHAEGGRGPLSLFFEATHEIDPAFPASSARPGSRRGELGELFTAAGVEDVEEDVLTIRVEHKSFEEWWEPFTLPVGPTVETMTALGPARVERLRELCRARLGNGPLAVEARAWAARGLSS